MKIIVSILFFVGLLSGCSNTTPEMKTSSDRPTTSQEKKKIYKEITLRENSLDTFPLPFPEKEILNDLEKFYSSYQVNRQIGQQDGPDFEFISISKDTIPVVYIRFDPDQRFQLDQIVILDSSAVDEYGVRVGDSYGQLKEKRQIEFQNQTDFHQHTYLFNENSNIYYEIAGDLNETQIENIENLELTEDQLQKWTVDKILWRK